MPPSRSGGRGERRSPQTLPRPIQMRDSQADSPRLVLTSIPDIPSPGLVGVSPRQGPRFVSEPSWCCIASNNRKVALPSPAQADSSLRYVPKAILDQ